MTIAGLEMALESTITRSGGHRVTPDLKARPGPSNRRFHNYQQLTPTFNNLGISGGQYPVPSTQQKPRWDFRTASFFLNRRKFVLENWNWVLGTRYWALGTGYCFSGNSQPLRRFLTAGGGLLFPRIPDT